MTETGMNTSNPIDGERRCGSVGMALPGISVRVVDAHGAICAPGAIGDIEVKGPNVFSGYWRMPERTREEFTDDGYFRTGDVGEMSTDRYLRIAGRAKDLIITGAAECLSEGNRGGDRRSARRGGVGGDRRRRSGLRRGRHRGRCGKARPCPARGGPHRRAQGRIIAGFKVPKRAYLVDELPRNAMGKVEKKLLRERYSAT